MPDILTDVTAEYLASMEPSADGLVTEMEAHAAEERIPIASRSLAKDSSVSVAALRAFNETFVDHDDLEAIVTPQGDGTGIAVKTS